MGGKLMARIMLTFDEASDKEEIKAAYVLTIQRL